MTEATKSVVEYLQEAQTFLDNTDDLGTIELIRAELVLARDRLEKAQKQIQLARCMVESAMRDF